VIVDAQRAGPSTGMPTRHEQGDLYLAAYGAHGDVPRIVLAPTSVEDCFYQAVNAFNLAERYQMPVILLQDTVLAVRTEIVPRPDLLSLRVEQRLLYQPNGEEKFRRYDLGAEDGVSPMSVPGTPYGQYTATGLEHSERARPRYDEVTHSEMTDKRFRKLEAARLRAPDALRYGTPGAPIAIVTWGSTAGSVMEAIDQASLDGLEVELIAPRMLRPLPDHQLVPFLQDRRVVLVPEVNFTGQFADMLTARYRGDYKRVNVYGGTAFKVRDLVRTIREAARDVGIRPEAGTIRTGR
jgi:2-oxoglutarate/2-oxoacid ferredoxin oxidoreductase subunit alpha